VKEARLLDSLSEGAISNAHFKRVAAPLVSEIENLRLTLASQKFDVLDVEEPIGYLSSMFWNPLCESNDLEHKSSLLKLLFANGVVFNSGVLEPKSTSFHQLRRRENLLVSHPTLSWNHLEGVLWRLDSLRRSDGFRAAREENHSPLPKAHATQRNSGTRRPKELGMRGTAKRVATTPIPPESAKPNYITAPSTNDPEIVKEAIDTAVEGSSKA
jgi:hypothetical protein